MCGEVFLSQFLGNISILVDVFCVLLQPFKLFAQLKKKKITTFAPLNKKNEKNMKIFSFLSKVVKIGLYLCRAKEMHKNMQKNIINKFANPENILYLCGYKKSETRKPRFKCFHNGIILIVSSIKFYGAKIDTFIEITKQFLIKKSIKSIIN